MARIKVIEFDGRFQQWQYWCEGCGDVHAFGPERHQFNGDLENPTISPSLLESYPGHVCHSFIKAGVIQYLDDCNHSLAGQTIRLPDIDEKLK